MKFLVDTQILIWAAYDRDKLSKEADRILNAKTDKPWFSTISLWEVALKRSKNRTDFQWEVGPLRQGLLDNDYAELDLTGEHILTFGGTAPGHRDPFDRLLLAQAISQGMVLLTADHELARCDGPIEFVG